MLRTASSQAWLIGLLATMASFCALNAFGEQPYSVVAQSTKATAGTGRKPIAQRLAASNLPVRAPADTACSEKGCPVPVNAPEPEAVPAPLTETDFASELAVAPEPTESTETDAGAADDALAAPAPAHPADTAAHPADTAAHPADTAAHPANTAAHPANTAARPGNAAKQTRAAPRRPQAEPTRQSLLDRVKGALVGKPKTHRPPARVAVPAEPAAPLPLPKPTPEETAAITAIEEPREIPETAVADDAASDTGTHAESFEHASTDIASSDAPTSEPGPLEAAVEDPLAGVPARLEFDVRESRSLVSEGEQVVMRIAVRNVGGSTAEAVHATLFFADGMEPVRAIGHTAEVFPGEVRFEQVPSIAPGKSVDLLVTAIGTRPGHVVYRGEVQCRQIPGRIAHEGAVTVRPRKPLK